MGSTSLRSGLPGSRNGGSGDGLETPLGADDESPFTISELVELVADTLEGQFRDVLLVGEIASFSTPGSGHCYFSLRDDHAAMDCVMWRTDAHRLTFRPESGDEVLCRGRLGVYAKQGRMQVYVQAMKPVGEGAAARALEALRAKLRQEGLFADERKRALPYLPRTIGVVTSRSGAVLHDILTTLDRRFPGFHVVLSPASVQGDEAPAQIVAALGRLAAYGACEVVIVGRGEVPAPTSRPLTTKPSCARLPISRCRSSPRSAMKRMCRWPILRRI